MYLDLFSTPFLFHFFCHYKKGIFPTAFILKKGERSNWNTIKIFDCDKIKNTLCDNYIIAILQIGHEINLKISLGTVFNR